VSPSASASPDVSPQPSPGTSGGPPRQGPAALVRWARHDARFDVPASLVVFLVAVPLSLGIAVASDAPVSAGLVAAVVGGIVAGFFGGSPLQVSGPAAGLTVVVAEIVAEFGWEATCAITVMAGLLQIVLGVSRLGRFALAISPTVVTAMLAGIGISIVLGQLNVALGHSSQPSALANLRGIVTSLGDPEPHAITAALGVVLILVLWPRLPKKVRAVPGPLVAVTSITLLAAAWLPGAERVQLGDALLEQIGSLALPDGTPLAVGGAVLTVALIASVESLLSAVAVDKLHDGPRSKLDKELLGQGMANAASGALGGLPVTGVIVRSSTNVTAGARTRASAILHGVWVAVFALLLVGLVEQVPLAALAGLLLVMGSYLVRPSDIRRSHSRGEHWVYAATVLGVLALNLVEGVLIGLACALVLVLSRTLRIKIDVRRAGTVPDGRELWVVDVSGSLTFLAAPMLARHLGSIPDGKVVEVDLLVDYLDPAGREQLEDWRERYTAAGGEVVLEIPGLDHHDGSDERASKAGPLTSRSFLPWDRWQNGNRMLGSEGRVAHPLAVGVREYHRRTAQTLAPVYADLAAGQSPQAVFIGCVDSRVVPNLLTSSGPGDLFTVRTMGNLVPVPGSEDSSVAAPLLYAVDVLGVDTVVVCGHSGCGAMTTCMDPSAPTDGPIAQWMSHADEAEAAWRAGHPLGRAAAAAGLGEIDQLAHVNIAVACRRVRDVLGPERDAAVTVVGMFLDVESGMLRVLREEEGAFVDLTDSELVELGHLAR
jgi:carbonic anhydrase